MTLSRMVSIALVVAVVPVGTAYATSIAPPTAAISIGMSPASPRAGSDVKLTGGAGAESYAWDLKLTPQARRALKRVRSVTLTLTATATADGAKDAQTTKVKITRGS